jgi:CBS domain-containing protein
MKRDVVSVAPELTLRELVEVFAEHEVSGAPVVAGGVVVGVISTTDIFEFREEAPDITLGPGGSLEEPVDAARRRDGPAAEFVADDWELEALVRMRTTRARDWSILDEYTAADVMTREVISQPSKTTVKKAAEYMIERGIHRVLVIDDGELQGIVTTTDIVRAVAEGRLKS